MKIKFALAAIALSLIISCVNNSPFKGYTCSETGLYYKLLSFGDGKKVAKQGQFLQIYMALRTLDDSLFFDSYSNNETGKVFLPYGKTSFKGSFEEGLSKMSEGDSVSFIINADSLFFHFFKSHLPVFLEKTHMVKLNVRLHKILTQQEYEQELDRFNQIIEDRDIEEQRKLQTYLDTVALQFYPLENGMYYLPEKQGIGDFPENGNLLKINYTGRFLNGKIFESTYERNQPLEFIYGQQGQVIDGFIAALNNMNEGAKAKFIIPSRLAFGEKGSSTGLIPPYTTVLYDIELITITKYNK
jgi:FKBP-type peptidyl-prolyl cis-trans isomerase FkpA